jgi:hypothetical protein
MQQSNLQQRLAAYQKEKDGDIRDRLRKSFVSFAISHLQERIQKESPYDNRKGA